METIHSSDENSHVNNFSVKIDILKDEINLDNYTLMNTSYVKQIYLDKTTYKVLLYLPTRLQMKLSTINLNQSQ